MRRVAFVQVGQEAKQMAMTIAERLRAEGHGRGWEEGRAEGREEGRAEEKVAIAQRLLRSGMAVSEVAKVTGLPEEQVRKLAQ